MPGQTIGRALRLFSRATHDGTVEVVFLGKVVELDVDQARELQRELTHSIGVASYGRPPVDALRPIGRVA